jgi:hypothetical protein
MKTTATPEIEQEAVANFVNQAKTVTPEQRKMVCEKMKGLIRRGERMLYQGKFWISTAAMQQTVNEIEAL